MNRLSVFRLTACAALLSLAGRSSAWAADRVPANAPVGLVDTLMKKSDADQAFDAAYKAHTVRAFALFIHEYPDSPKAQEARRLAEILPNGKEELAQAEAELGGPEMVQTESHAEAKLATPIQRNRFELYLAPLLSVNSFSGDQFDGHHTLYGGGEFLFIPKMQTGVGLGVVTGFRMGLRSAPVDWAFQFSFQDSKHDTSFASLPGGEAHLDTVNFDLKLFFRSGQHLQPWFLVGRNGNAVTFKNGSSLGGDAVYYGGGWNLGAGLSYYLNRIVSADLGVIHRWISFDQAEGRTGTSDIQGPLSATSLSGQVSVTLHWGLKKID